MELARRLVAGDVQALARAIRLVEERDESVPALLAALRPQVRRARVVGLTGPPGSGKSTIGDQLIERWRRAGQTVGVIAVDPSSPFSGGAILGDRVRMQRHSHDPGVYIRSMAARGHLGGLAGATREAVRLIAAAGRNRCLVETVGVGQSEIEIMETADTTVVVTTPNAGDGVQFIKAGILEIADIFVVNKSDLPRAPRVARELRDLVHGGSARTRRAGMAWEPPVVMLTATTGDGVDDLTVAIDRHYEAAEACGQLERRRRARIRAEIAAIVVERAAARAHSALEGPTMEEELGGDLANIDPYEVAGRILDGRLEAPSN